MVTLFAFSAGVYAQSEPEGGHAYMGIKLDRIPLPDLLRKHLGLSPDQGIRIINVYRDAPGDKAGLERDDIIIGFQGKDVNNNDELVSAVRKAGVGSEVTLEIIHLGKRKTVEVKLEAFNGKVDLKYPPEPESEMVWRPSKVFKLQPGEGNWVEIPFEELPGNLELNIKMPFEDGSPGSINEVHMFHFNADGETYTITINGNPNNNDTEITVRVGETEYKTKVGAIGELPEKYRASVEESLEKARKSPRERTTEKKVDIDEKLNFPFNSPVPPIGPDDKMFDRIEKQMLEFQNRLEKLEELQKDILERLSDKLKKQQSQETQGIAQNKV
jgi:hypothetical protein